jgi:allophanate hydrolase
MRLDLSIPALQARYRAGLTPLQLVEMLHEQMCAEDAALDRNIWIRRLSLDEMRVYALALENRDMASLPLYGIPFAIKDNIDLAGIATTAACAEFSYLPEVSATAVQRLIDAGAIPIGKTNLDQFATGLVGTRSPYGACKNSINPAYVSGGSSAGSAVSVALGLASFSLGTDTAGSGRVPAMFNNLVGLKPSCGRIPTTGVIPACRTLDVVSIFALTAGDAASVLACAQGLDDQDAYSRDLPPHGHNFGLAPTFKFGVPRQADLAFHGNTQGPAQFAKAIAHLQALGGTPVEIDLRPFLAVAALLYDGPWVAERYQAIRSFIESQPEALHPVTLAITEKAKNISAADTFASLYKLKALERETRKQWLDIDCMLTPTASTPYTIEAVNADPIQLNSNLGYYTNYVNLLDLAAVAVPTGFMPPEMDSMPWGVTLVAPAGKDLPLLSLAARLHAASALTVGATEHAPHLHALATPNAAAFPSGLVQVAVCGAHLSGLPLNWQLTQRGAKLVSVTKSAACYKLFALPGGPPFRPGMLRVAEGGVAIDVEVWALDQSAFGSFVAGIPAPLGIGSIELADGKTVLGFTCEAYAVMPAASAATQAKDISALGGWRQFLAQPLV